MKKLLTFLSLFFVLAVTPAFASQRNHGSVSTEAGCAAEDDWKNHGEFVSCVAHQHLGGQIVSEAAKSDIGKHDDEDEDENEEEDGDDDDNLTASPTPEVSPSPTVSPSPSVSPSPEVSPSPDVSPSPTPEVSPSPGPTTQLTGDNRNMITIFIEKLQDLINELQNLL